MPALIVFGRRSRVGSDDLYCPAFVMLVFQCPFLALSVMYAAFWRGCSTMAFNMQGAPFWFTVGAVPIFAFMACIYLSVVHISTKGAIVEQERRVLMPRVLHVHALWSLWTLLYGTLGVLLWCRAPLCLPDGHFVLVTSSAMVTQVGLTGAFGLCILGGAPRGDPRAHFESPQHGKELAEIERQSLLDEMDRSIPSSDVYVPHPERWEQRCKSLCSCIRCFTCNLFGGGGAEHDSLSIVANVFSRLFYGSPDLVVSDIVAGFVLLAAVQTHEEVNESEEKLRALEGVATLRDLRQQAEKEALGVVETPVIDGDTVVTPSTALPDGTYVAITMPRQLNEANVAPITMNVDPDLINSVQELAYYSKYAIGVYGWLLFVWSHPWSSIFRLAFSWKPRRRQHVHGDNVFGLSHTALLRESKAHSKDVVYASFHNSVYCPAFCVVLDHEKKQVVLAIRGTISLEDCLTDAIAYGMPLDDVAERLGCEGKGEFAHQGFLHAAEKVYSELMRTGVLEMLLDPQSDCCVAMGEVNSCDRGAFQDYGLTVVGHSMGAATAVLVSIMLRPKYPNLRCFAYSPPGCTVSPRLARECSSFVTSVVVGFDIVARASLTTIEALRDRVLELIGRSKVNKAEILRQVVAWKRPDELLYGEDSPMDGGDAGLRAHLSNYLTMLRRIQAHEPINPLAIPGKVIHLKRQAVQQTQGCWVCCRPGSGGMCCTARTNYDFGWASPDEFSEIKIARTMLDDHFPDKVHQVLKDCNRRLRQPSTGGSCRHKTQ